jgi:hypothetical protein
MKRMPIYSMSVSVHGFIADRERSVTRGVAILEMATPR